MVSEDSDSLGSVFPPIHRCRQCCDSFEPLVGEVIALCHPLHTLSELLEIFPFCGLKWIGSEKRDDYLEQLVASAHNIAVKVFLVIIFASVGGNLTDAKELFELLQGVQTALALSHSKLVEHLYSNFVARAPFSSGLMDKPY